MKPHHDRIGYLEQLHDYYNAEDFDNQLMQITLLVKKNRHKDGIYEYAGRKDFSPIRERLHKASIMISRGCWDEDSIEGSLLHEMIHQYQTEVLDVPPHHDDWFNTRAEELEKKYGFDIK